MRTKRIGPIMKYSKILVAISLAFTANSALAETHNLIISPKANTEQGLTISSQSTSNKTCFTSIKQGTPFCLTQPGTTKQSDISSQSTRSPFSPAYVESSELETRDIINTMMASGKYNSVEYDIIVKSTGALNDTLYSEQTYLFPKSDKHINGMNFEQANDLIPDSAENVDMIIIDSGFVNHEDIPYADGYSFTRKSGQLRNVDYITLPEFDGSTLHGSAVASMAAALRNNDFTVAGASKNINVFAARSLFNGSGRMSDISDALLYAAAEDTVHESPGLTKRTKPMHVANLSLGGLSACPDYMQYAIDKANEKGISVVVAAGNESSDAIDFTPANCKGVIVVSATTSLNELAWFSNYGDEITISAQGTDVVGVNGVDNTETLHLWNGTSMSTPLVAGAVALAKHANLELSSADMKRLVEFTATPIYGVVCRSLDCGSGLLDALRLTEEALKSNSDREGVIKHALSGKTSCDQTWLLDHFGEKTDLCNSYKVTFFGGLESKTNHFKLSKVTKGKSFGEGSEHVLKTQYGSLVLSELSSTHDYAYQYCSTINEELVCEDNYIPIHVDETKPAACK
jgi:serine protease